jgi:hypothetical protein
MIAPATSSRKAPTASVRGLLIAAMIAATGAAAGAQEVTLTRIIGEGDTLPNGWPWGGGGLASLDGDRIAFIGTTMQGDAICVHEIATGEFRLLADTTMRSPTYPDFDFKTMGNPAISGDDVVFPGAALLFTGEWEGLYHASADGAGPISVVIDELHPAVRIPSLPVLSEAGALFRDRGHIGEPVAFSTLSGDYRQVAFRGDPAPGGGTFFDMEPPAIGGNLGAFRAMVTLPTANLWGAYAWRADTGELFLAARENDPIPGRLGVFDIVLAEDSDGRQVLINGKDSGFPNPYRGVYAWDGAQLNLLVEKGDLMPEGGGAVFNFVSGIAIDGDSMIFRGMMSPARSAGSTASSEAGWSRSCRSARCSRAPRSGTSTSPPAPSRATASSSTSGWTAGAATPSTWRPLTPAAAPTWMVTVNSPSSISWSSRTSSPRATSGRISTAAARSTSSISWRFRTNSPRGARRRDAPAGASVRLADGRASVQAALRAARVRAALRAAAERAAGPLVLAAFLAAAERSAAVRRRAAFFACSERALRDAVLVRSRFSAFLTARAALGRGRVVRFPCPAS